jgi:hypothetical protein
VGEECAVRLEVLVGASVDVQMGRTQLSTNRKSNSRKPATGAFLEVWTEGRQELGRDQ